MTKRTQSIDVDTFEKAAKAAEAVNNFAAAINALPPETLAQIRLLDSGIITAAEGAISWREGHLEHVARVYVSDSRLAWRDYADDLTVALSADGGTFAALVEQARGE